MSRGEEDYNLSTSVSLSLLLASLAVDQARASHIVTAVKSLI